MTISHPGFPHIFLIVLFMLSLSLGSDAQKTHPTGYFRSPIDFTPSLSGTFAEIRTGHFHSGIDYRTQGVEGKPIYAAADGFVSRIRISPGGFGKAIYVEHPNGYTTVYAHLRNFAVEIQRYIISEQYRQESFDVDLFPESKSIRVKKGDVIAFSGNSGSSSGPHLHFEIRNTHNQKPVNPKLFALNIRDEIPPVIQALKIYPANDYSTINGVNQSKLFEITGANGKYWLSNDQPIRIAGDVAFGIQAYDMHNNSNLRNGIAIINIFIENEHVYAYRVDEFAFEETRYVNAVIDYEELIKSKRRFIQTRILPNNPLRIYPQAGNDGIFTFSETANRVARIEVEDAAGNKAVLQFRISSLVPSYESIMAKEMEGKTLFRYNQVNKYQAENLYLEIPPMALYDDIWFSSKTENRVQLTIAGVYHIHNIYTPVHKAYSLAIKPEISDMRIIEKSVIVRRDDKGNWVSEGGSFKDGFVTTTTRNFGVFSVMADTIAPKITPVNISNNKNISQQKDIRVKISDALSGIKSYRGTINDKWILMDYDPKNELLVYEIDDRTSQGSNLFKLVVVDHTGNRSEYRATLIR